MLNDRNHWYWRGANWQGRPSGGGRHEPGETGGASVDDWAMWTDEVHENVDDRHELDRWLQRTALALLCAVLFLAVVFGTIFAWRALDADQPAAPTRWPTDAPSLLACEPKDECR